MDLKFLLTVWAGCFAAMMLFKLERGGK
jgi:hypothetical protein